MRESLRVVVTEPIMDRFRSVLTRDGTSPHRWTFVREQDAPSLAADADVLVCSAATPQLLGAAPDLQLVHVTGAGVDKIPVGHLPPTAALVNTFHHGRSIAEHVLMVSMMLLRRVPAADRAMRRGEWRNVVVDDAHPFGGVLAGRTMGIVGLGEIGGSVAELAGLLGMRVRAVRRDPGAPAPAAVEHVGPVSQLHAMLAASDVVVVTVPLNEHTRGLVDAAALAAMRSDAVLVNVARGAVVDEQALHDALSAGTIGGAGIDVWWRNPRDADAPPPSNLDFTGFANVVLTPHQSGHTEEVFAGRAADIADNVDALAEGRPLRNVVRPALRPAAGR
ncbi:2-hydroxyacid dehydrogenase [Pseudonocardia sp. MH-G8]|uniref:2-hydroxyacid dehydrogenase n=1 Tax=Pseudonocardia sp. MH-G8 TaxID=1854588 RepID=UPI0018E9423C|nr:2-hydroxyacid dehydrogenase [Pseudonocardia sp. MH-G8]